MYLNVFSFFSRWILYIKNSNGAFFPFILCACDWETKADAPQISILVPGESVCLWAQRDNSDGYIYIQIPYKKFHMKKIKVKNQ